jgi:hypothetical protein
MSSNFQPAIPRAFGFWRGEYFRLWFTLGDARRFRTEYPAVLPQG